MDNQKITKKSYFLTFAINNFYYLSRMCLVKDEKLSFREAYKISSKIVNYAEKNKKNLDELTLNEIKKFYKHLSNNVLKIFNVKNSMNSKNSYGGTSERNIKNMIRKYTKELK